MAKTIGLTFEPERTKHVCDVCGKEFASDKKLADHIAKEHPTE